MASRIDEQVVRGEIDNRARGRVAGRLWLHGRVKPVELELEGNCWRDLAGRRLEFTNPQPKPGHIGGLLTQQYGVVGNITASLKVKVPEVNMDELVELQAQGKPVPWHWGNALYLEWFGECNGRIVIESANYELKIVGEPTWEMTPNEEMDQSQANSKALTDFLDGLVTTPRAQAPEVDETTMEWTIAPQTEAEAEEEQARSDLLMDRIEARMRRDGKDANYEKILEEEINRMRREHGETELTSEQFERKEWIEEVNRVGKEPVRSPDPELQAELEWKHPLAERVMALSLGLIVRAKAEGWYRDDVGSEHPVAVLLNTVMIAGPKYAGTLNGKYWPPEVDYCAHTIVQLKRVRVFVEDALRAAVSCEEDQLISPKHLGSILAELMDFLRDTDGLIAELRARL